MRPDKWIKWISRSLFTRLFLVLLAAGICINLLVGLFFGHIFKYRVQNTVNQTVGHYIRYLIADMGEPPNPVQAEQIASESSLEICFQGSNGTGWMTSGGTSDLEGIDWQSLEDRPGVRVGRRNGRHFVAVPVISGTLIFEAGQLDFNEHNEHLVILLVCGLSIILIAAYLVIRRILRPLEVLKKGVLKIGRGGLDHRVPNKGAREFGELAEAFNEMTDRIGKMITEKEQLLLDVSHELRSPITRMKVALEFLDNDQTRNSIAGDVAEMEQMVTEILETARLRSADGNLKKQTFDLVHLVIETAAAFRQPPGIDASQLPPAAPIQADPGLVKTVVQNIFTNAVKYSGPECKPVLLTVETAGAEIALVIADDGPGIPTKDLPHIFEPFYRVDKSRSKGTGGYGLGLSLCKTIMEAHGGRIEISSGPEKGTCVKLFFAAAEISA